MLGIRLLSSGPHPALDYSLLHSQSSYCYMPTGIGAGVESMTIDRVDGPRHINPKVYFNIIFSAELVIIKLNVLRIGTLGNLCYR